MKKMKEEDFNEIEIEMDPEVERKILKKLKVINALLVIMVLALGGVVIKEIFLKDSLEEKNNITDKRQNPSESSKPTQENDIKKKEEEEIKISKELIEELFNMVYDSMYCGNRLYSHFGSKKITPDDFSNLEKNYIVIMNLAKEKEPNSNPKYTKEQIIEVKNHVLGKNTSFEMLDNGDYQQFYPEKDGEYSVDWSCGADICMSENENEFIKGIQKGNKIYLDQEIIFTEYTQKNEELDTVKYYKDYNKTQLLGEKDFNSSEDYYKYVTIDSFKNQGSIYRYTYQVNEDGTYTFLQIENIK